MPSFCGLYTARVSRAGSDSRTPGALHSALFDHGTGRLVGANKSWLVVGGWDPHGWDPFSQGWNLCTRTPDALKAAGGPPLPSGPGSGAAEAGAGPERLGSSG